MDYNVEAYEAWLDDVAYQFFALLGEDLEDYDADYLTYFLDGVDAETTVRLVYES